MPGSVLCAFPEARTLDIHPDVIHGRIAFCKGYGVLSPAAAKLQDDWIVIAEHLPSPVALYCVVIENQLPRALYKDLRRRRLKQAAESLVLCEFLEFTVSHNLSLQQVQVP